MTKNKQKLNFHTLAFRIGGGFGNSFLFSTKSSTLSVADIIISLRVTPRCERVRNNNLMLSNVGNHSRTSTRKIELKRFLLVRPVYFF